MLKELFKKRIDLVSLLAILMFTMSLTTMDFNNFDWSTNSNSYVGFLIFIVLIVFKKIADKNQHSSD